MNNRIRELTQEAGIIYGTAVDYYYTRATDGVVSRQMEKFAELIVQECVKIINEFGEDIENGDILRSPKFESLAEELKNNHLGSLLWKSGELIEEHFGVMK